MNKATLVSLLILLPCAYISGHGTVELFGGDTLETKAAVALAAAGMELALLTLIAVAARFTGRARAIYAIAGTLTMAASMAGQYAYFVTRAHGAERTVETAETDAGRIAADREAIQGELATVRAALATESKSGFGPRARSLSERAGELQGKLDTMDAQAAAVRPVIAQKKPLLVVCERFGWNPELAVNIATGVLVLVLNMGGFLLRYAGALQAIPAPKPAPKRRRASARKKAAPAVIPTPTPTEVPAAAPVAEPVIVTQWTQDLLPLFPIQPQNATPETVTV